MVACTLRTGQLGEGALCIVVPGGGRGVANPGPGQTYSVWGQGPWGRAGVEGLVRGVGLGAALEGARAEGRWTWDLSGADSQVNRPWPPHVATLPPS